jgi:6,7-dimethyl-8-ribityllumazine synthase
MGLIATENFDQAKQRCDPSALNKGKEIAQSLAEML